MGMWIHFVLWKFYKELLWDIQGYWIESELPGSTDPGHVDSNIRL